MTEWLDSIAYHRRGSGSPLVLLHGIGHRWQAWEPVLDHLAQQHEVIALDLPGFGASPTLPQPYTVPNAIDALGEFFAHLGISQPHVAGNSLGGALSLELASAGLVSSATAFAPAGFWTARDRAWALWALGIVRMGGRIPLKARTAMLNLKLLRLLGGSLLFGRPDRLPVQTMLDDLTAMAGAVAFDTVATTGRAYLFQCAPPRVPVTVAWGTRDRILWPRQAKKAAELLPAATHVSLPDCGHVPMYDDPQLVARTILDTCRTGADGGATDATSAAGAT
jgi:pimeloyl-ACP methyl ester carboxylesterase